MSETNKMALSIGRVQLDGRVCLAPMAGVSDISYRLLAKEQRASLVCTEMVSAMGIKYDNEHTKELLYIENREKPVSLQIFGSDPRAMAEAAKVVEDVGADIVDINMGCPVKKVVASGDGSALMKTPDLAASVAEAVVKAVQIPVTVKMRLGWDEAHKNAVDFARRLENSGVVALTVHGRTREQMYSGKADWEYIRRVKKAVRIPVFGNGDVTDVWSAKAMFDETECDGIMIGRAAQGNPWIFNEVRSFLENGVLLEPPSPEERLEMMRRHLDLMVFYKAESIAVKEMRTHAGWYTKGMPGSARWRAVFTSITTRTGFLEAISRYEEELSELLL